MTLDQFLTPYEIDSCITLWRTRRSTFHNDVLTKIIIPNMERINKALGQENDPRYLAYAVEYAMGRVQ